MGCELSACGGVLCGSSNVAWQEVYVAVHAGALPQVRACVKLREDDSAELCVLCAGRLLFYFIVSAADMLCCP